MFLIANLSLLLLSLWPTSAKVNQSYKISVKSDGECPDACPLNGTILSSAKFETCVNALQGAGWPDCAINKTMSLSGTEVIVPCHSTDRHFATIEVASFHQIEGVDLALGRDQSIILKLNNPVQSGCAYHMVSTTEATDDRCPVDTTAQLSGTPDVMITSATSLVPFPLPVYETIAVAVPTPWDLDCLNFASATYDGIQFNFSAPAAPDGAHFGLSAPVSLLVLLTLFFIEQ